ncbi:MAG: thioredoxin fold domain-containing protein [Desulfobacterales bacterium]|nr:thioredoxin fold domain-containing protein [Desulfobacterales bacterium]
MMTNKKYPKYWHGLACTFIFFLLLITDIPADQSDTSPVFHVGIDAAYESAQKDNSLVLLIFRAKWCVFCKAFNKTTLESDEFRKSRANVHVVMIDVDTHKKLATEFNIKSIPDSVLLDGDGKIIDRHRGLMEPAELLAWIAQAEQKSQKGEWVSFSQSGEFGKFLERFDKGSPTDADYKKLVAMLGSKNPGDRTLAAKVALAEGENIMPFLIDAAEDKYLVFRIGASEILSKLVPEAPEINPWASEKERKLTVAQIRSWWAETGRLSTSPAKTRGKPANAKSAKNALNDVISNDPVRRTEAMTFLVETGNDALPSLREAVKQAEARSDHKSVWALEDIRWTILVPFQVTREIPNIRRTLARGSSRERQGAAEKLGNLGASAIPVLTELIRDSDPLVQEVTVHSLAKINSDNALEVMAILLKSENANLRMVAAQLIGKTGEKDAVKYLATILNDPDEVVAGTAIAALKELNAVDAGNDLIACLEDSRWRIRAAAAEAVGELKFSAAGDALKKLVRDTDPFVVKSAVIALSRIGLPLNPEEIRSLITENPDLITVAVSQILRNESEQGIKILSEVFDELSLQNKMALLDMLSQEDSYNDKFISYWKPLFEKFLANKEPAVRLKAVSALAKCSLELACDLTSEILRDTNIEVYQAGTGMALSLICYHYGYEERSERSDYNIMSLREKILANPDLKNGRDYFNISAEDMKKMAERAELVYEHHREWQKLLLEKKETPSLEKTLVISLAGRASENIDQLTDTFTEKNVQYLLKKKFGFNSLRLVLSRLPWPESETLIRNLVKTPDLYAVLAAVMDKADPGLIDYVLNEKYLLENLKHIEKENLALFIYALLSPSGSRAASLMSRTDKAAQLSLSLMNASDPLLKSIGTNANSERETVATGQFTQLLKNKNPWVRRSALMALIKRVDDPEKLEIIIGPMLSDEMPEVAKAAIIGLLAQDIRQSANFHDILPRYKYEDIEISSDSDMYLEETERPLLIIGRKPAFLEQAWKLFESNDQSKEKELIAPLTLVLMAQYGEFRALDTALRDWEPDSLEESEIFTAIELSRDVKYIPWLKKYADQETDMYKLRKILGVIRQMSGKEARSFRIYLNKRLRDGI